MSRLDSMIRRLKAQRACLAYAAGQVHDLPGPIFELGLGNGRTYDHLRQLMPEREIFVFERQVAADVGDGPDAAYLILGDIHETLPAATARFAGKVPLIHSDIGTGDNERNKLLAAFLARHLPVLMAPGGVLIADMPMPSAEVSELAPPAGVKPGRYFLYRRVATASRRPPPPGPA